MPENEFEKEVQKKMEELKLIPSGKVWETVLSNLQPKRKRRKKLVQFLMFLCFLLIVIIFLSVIKTTRFFEKPVADLNRSTGNKNVPIKELNPLFKNNKKEKSKNEVQYPKIKKEIINADNNAPATQQSPAIISVDTKSGINPSYKRIKNSAGKKLIKIAAGSIEETAGLNNQHNENSEQSSPEQNKNTPTNKDVIVINTDSSIKQVTPKKIADTIANKSVANTKNLTKNKKTNKWLFGFSAAIGKSATGSGYFASGNNSNYNYLSSPITNTGGNAGNGYQPSAIHSAVAFSIGIQATHKLSPKINIVFGLNYKLMRTSLLVGKDSIFNNAIIYSIGNTKTYHNNYHLVELPIGLELQIISIKKHPIFFDAGLSISQLLHTNALQFDPAQGKYFVDNNLFHKSIISISAGLSINIANSKSAPLLIGPQFYYSLTKLANTGLYNNGRYSFAGIRLQKILAKKIIQ